MLLKCKLFLVVVMFYFVVFVVLIVVWIGKFVLSLFGGCLVVLMDFFWFDGI